MIEYTASNSLSAPYLFTNIQTIESFSYQEDELFDRQEKLQFTIDQVRLKYSSESVTISYDNVMKKLDAWAIVDQSPESQIQVKS